MQSNECTGCEHRGAETCCDDREICQPVVNRFNQMCSVEDDCIVEWDQQGPDEDHTVVYNKKSGLWLVQEWDYSGEDGDWELVDIYPHVMAVVWIKNNCGELYTPTMTYNF